MYTYSCLWVLIRVVPGIEVLLLPLIQNNFDILTNKLSGVIKMKYDVIASLSVAFASKCTKGTHQLQRPTV